MMPKKTKPSDLISRAQLPEWLNLKVVAILVLLGLFMVAMSWTTPSSSQAHKAGGIVLVQATQPAPNAASATRTATPIPAEWAANREMANGIVLGAIALVLIIVGGTLAAIRRK